MVPCPPNVSPIGFKLLYMIKFKANGSLDQYRAWLVALEINKNMD